MQVMTLSEFLRQNQVTLTEFASQIGTTVATVSRIADGIVVPRRKLLLRIFEVTGGLVTPNDVTGIHAPAKVNKDRETE
jgi:transcriptional regulator with XRE-family HTH domain